MLKPGFSESDSFLGYFPSELWEEEVEFSSDYYGNVIVVAIECAPDKEPQSVQYDGIDFTLVVEGLGGDSRVQVWILPDPPTEVSATLSVSIPFNDSWSTFACYHFFNVYVDDPIYDYNAGAIYDIGIQNSVGTRIQDLVVDFGTVASGAVSYANVGQDVLHNEELGVRRTFSSTKAGTGMFVSMGWELIGELPFDFTQTVIALSGIGDVIASAGGPYSGQVGKQIALHGEAYQGLPDYYFYWDLDNDGIYETEGQDVFFNAITIGEFTVNLKVIDDLDDESFDSTTVTVEEASSFLIASAGGPYSGHSKEYVEIIASAESGIEPYIFYWDLDGDGIYETIGQSILYLTPNTAGTYNLKLKVVDSGLNEAFDETTIEVSYLPLTLNVQSFVKLDFKSQVVLSAVASGGAGGYSYSWDLDGDGIYETFGQSVLYVADNFGEYTILVKVVDTVLNEKIGVMHISISEELEIKRLKYETPFGYPKVRVFEREAGEAKKVKPK